MSSICAFNSRIPSLVSESSACTLLLSAYDSISHGSLKAIDEICVICLTNVKQQVRAVMKSSTGGPSTSLSLRQSAIQLMLILRTIIGCISSLIFRSSASSASLSVSRPSVVDSSAGFGNPTISNLQVYVVLGNIVGWQLDGSNAFTSTELRPITQYILCNDI